MSGFLVATKPCSQCPFLGSDIVRPGRVKDILRTLVRKDSHFVCHKSLPQWPGRITTGEAACRGYWDLMLKGKAHPGQMVRIAERLNCVEFVDVESARPLHVRSRKGRAK